MIKETNKPTEEIVLNQALVREYLSYNELTGDVVWLKDRKGKASEAGSKAGCWHIASTNMCIRFFGVKFILSHIIFLWKTGRLPSRMDYIDGDRSNMKWENLKENTKKNLTLVVKR